MAGTIVKLILSLISGFLGYQQIGSSQKIAAVFCFMISALLLLSFFLDLIRLLWHKFTAKSEEKPEKEPSPVPENYPRNPDPADLKIGKTYRAVEVSKFLSNIQALAEENPDYALSESEILDHYLTDKKLWKYVFHPKNTTLEIIRDKEKNSFSIGVFINGFQVGSLKASDSSELIKAINGKGIEVVYCTIGGGPYKIVHEDVISGKYNIFSDEKAYSVTLSIYEK